MYDVLYAIVACGAMLAAVLLAAFAYIINEKWTEFVNRQNDLLDKMNREWCEVYMKMVDMKAEEKNGQD